MNSVSNIKQRFTPTPYNLAYEVNSTKMTIVDYSSLCYIYNLFLVIMFQIHIPRLVIPVERDDLFLD